MSDVLPVINPPSITDIIYSVIGRKHAELQKIAVLSEVLPSLQRTQVHISAYFRRVVQAD